MVAGFVMPSAVAEVARRAHPLSSPDANSRAVNMTTRPPQRVASSALRLCRVCKQHFDPAKNEYGSCKYHPGYYAGRLNRVAPTETSGLEYFWECCGHPDKDAPPCQLSRHLTYDDD